MNKSKQTLIQWLNSEDELPPIDTKVHKEYEGLLIGYNWIPWEEFIYSSEVLGTDGEDLYYVRYIYNWGLSLLNF